jgi:hypothetical protein
MPGMARQGGLHLVAGGAWVEVDLAFAAAAARCTSVRARARGIGRVSGSTDGEHVGGGEVVGQPASAPPARVNGFP